MSASSFATTRGRAATRYALNWGSTAQHDELEF
jgi:hypothetical protein